MNEITTSPSKLNVGSKETPSDPNRNIDRPTSEDQSREGVKGAGASVFLDAAEANVDERARAAGLALLHFRAEEFDYLSRDGAVS